MKHLLKSLMLVSVCMLASCQNEVSKTPRQWCIEEAQAEFAFDYDGQYGIAFVREADEYFVDIQPENQVYAYLIDIVHEGVPDAVISEYFAWIELKDKNAFQRFFGFETYPESYIIDIGCELIERN